LKTLLTTVENTFNGSYNTFFSAFNYSCQALSLPFALENNIFYAAKHTTGVFNVFV